MPGQSEDRRAQLRREVQAAWAAYQADGLHLTAEEVDTWLKKLAAGEDAKPPECHD